MAPLTQDEYKAKQHARLLDSLGCQTVEDLENKVNVYYHASKYCGEKAVALLKILNGIKGRPYG